MFGVAVPVMLKTLPLDLTVAWLLLGLRWLLWWLLAVGSLSVLYRFAPHRARAMEMGDTGLRDTLWVIRRCLVRFGPSSIDLRGCRPDYPLVIAEPIGI